MFRILIAAALVGLAVMAGQLWRADAVQAQTAQTTADRSYGLDLVHYATVRRTDGSFRRMLITRAELAALEAGDPLPDGARILMETYRSPDRLGTVFHKQKQDGRWLYGAFSGQAAEPNLSVQPRASCLSCHTRAAATDFTYTYPSLQAVAAGAAATDFACDRSGRAPCDLEVYRGGAGAR